MDLWQGVSYRGMGWRLIDGMNVACRNDIGWLAELDLAVFEG